MLSERIQNHKVVSVILSVSAAVFAVALLVNATTVGDNVTVTSALTVNGNTTLGNAVTDTITMTGVFTGFVSNASSTASDNFTVGALLRSQGLATLNSGFVSQASSTVSGTFNVDTSIGIASSSPSQELGVTGDAYISSTLGVATSTAGQELGVNGSGLFQELSGTTTIGLNSVGTGVGSCIQLRTANGASSNQFRVYAGATSTKGYLIVEAGSCKD